jgi:tetratricopeptide (TPR) repeat protein
MPFTKTKSNPSEGLSDGFGDPLASPFKRHAFSCLPPPLQNAYHARLVSTVLDSAMKHSLARYLVHLGIALALGLPGASAFADDADGPGDTLVPGINTDTGDDADAEVLDDDGDDDDTAASDILSPATGEQLPPQDLTPETLYDYLFAEIAGARGELDLSAQTFINLARKTRDPRIARRAAQVAFIARNPALATEAAQLWRETAPQSREANQLVENIARGRTTAFDNVQALLARALARHPDRIASNLLGLNSALSKADDKEATRKVIYNLTEPYLKHPEAYFARAQASSLAKRSMEAMGSIERALELRQDWQPALLFKAHLLIEANSADKASQLLADALSRQPDSHELRLAHARSLIVSRQYSAARTEFSALLKAAPDDRELIYTVALLSVELNDPATAEPLLEKSLANGHPQADAIRIQLGRLAEDRGNSVAARKWFDAVGPGSNAAEARIRSAQSLAKEGRLNQARKLLRDAPDPETRRRYLFADSQLLSDAGRVKEAYQLIDKALNAQPDDSDLLYESAMLAERAGMHEIMEGRLRKLIALKADHAHAYNALGYSLADRGLRLDEAEALVARALELLPKDAFIMDSVGWIRFKRGDLPGALKQLEEAYALRADPEIAAHLGEVLWKLNRNNDARRILDTALKANPKNTSLQDVIRRLYKPGKKR